MSFIHDDFLLSTEASRRLYHEHAAGQPIIDYHNHLPSHDIANNRQFADLSELWLEGDHYKWRALRANGFDERFVTGDATGREKYEAWAATVPMTLRNPLYHWAHLELKRYFGVDELLDTSSAGRIWEAANAALPDLSTHNILERLQVTALCTTDDPVDDLSAHRTILESDCATAVYPTFRPDRAMMVDRPETFNSWCDKLTAVTDIETGSLDGFLQAVDARHDFFHQHGCRLSDHDLAEPVAEQVHEREAAKIYAAARSGLTASASGARQFKSFMMQWFAALDARRDWTKQLHIGALRNVNSRQYAALGADSGFDTIGDAVAASELAAMLDLWDRDGALPRLVLYNLNPVDNYLFAAMVGSFQGSAQAGKIQFGSGWWFLDQKQGMIAQLDALSNCGLLSRFIGMLTDSRSFMSFPRHEYFRRILCDLLGKEIELGELPLDFDLIGGIVRRICYENARDYLKLPSHSTFERQ